MSRSLAQVFTCKNAPYDVNGNMIIHMGGSMSMGYGIIYEKASKHKTNLKNLT